VRPQFAGNVIRGENGLLVFISGHERDRGADHGELVDANRADPLRCRTTLAHDGDQGVTSGKLADSEPTGTRSATPTFTVR